VHRTGYRDKVVDIGKLLNLVGYAENLPDGRVRITDERLDIAAGRYCHYKFSKKFFAMRPQKRVA
jgi:acylphosphatase